MLDDSWILNSQPECDMTIKSPYGQKEECIKIIMFSKEISQMLIPAEIPCSTIRTIENICY